MAQSLSMVYLHAVFSTKERVCHFKEEKFRGDVMRYMAGVAEKMNCPCVEIGGTEDHVHMLMRMGREITQAQLIKEIKRISSIWIKEKKPGLHDFHWQSGYGLFSVSPSTLNAVRKYIQNQKAHHEKMDFKIEFRALLKKHGIEWDERFVWD